jgi:hypothetical protein
MKKLNDWINARADQIELLLGYVLVFVLVLMVAWAASKLMGY